jgi:hypothetical protein
MVIVFARFLFRQRREPRPFVRGKFGSRQNLVQHRQLGSVRFHASDQLVLDFFLDHLQPLLSSRGADLKTVDLLPVV